MAAEPGNVKLLLSAEKIIKAQDRLLVAYRTGGRPPEWVFKDLDRFRPIWDAHITDMDSRVRA